MSNCPAVVARRSRSRRHTGRRRGEGELCATRGRSSRHARSSRRLIVTSIAPLLKTWVVEVNEKRARERRSKRPGAMCRRWSKHSCGVRRCAICQRRRRSHLAPETTKPRLRDGSRIGGGCCRSRHIVFRRIRTTHFCVAVRAAIRSPFLRRETAAVTARESSAPPGAKSFST